VGAPKTVAERAAPEPARIEHESGTRLDPLLGSLVAGKYRVDRVLASGGMGRVYVATQQSVERRVALKVVLHDEAGSAEAQRRFRLEGEILARLCHPNIVTLYDFGALDPPFTNRSYLAMELLEGQTLSARLDRQRRLPVAEVLGLAAQMVRALRFAHGLGVVHRDMKPSNLMLLPDVDGDGGARLKILDFGTGQLVNAEPRRPSRSSASWSARPPTWPLSTSRGVPVPRAICSRWASSCSRR
jgi:serine/threonine-protein kinase